MLSKYKSEEVAQDPGQSLSTFLRALRIMEAIILHLTVILAFFHHFRSPNFSPRENLWRRACRELRVPTPPLSVVSVNRVNHANLPATYSPHSSANRNRGYVFLFLFTKWQRKCYFYHPGPFQPTYRSVRRRRGKHEQLDASSARVASSSGLLDAPNLRR